jgi:serine/threonine-protein kinase
VNTEPEKISEFDAGGAFEVSLDSDTGSDLSDTRILRAGDIPHVPEVEADSDAKKAGTEGPSWTGKRMGHFRLMRLIGEGAMGRVYQAKDVNLERIVALKVLRQNIPGMDPASGVQQFLREARAAARIDHPHVVQIYEINQHHDWWYIAMEFVEGDTLQHLVKAAGMLPPEKACPLLADAAGALAVAHELGIIHRDIKPSNLLITRDGRCKLTDFGLVRLDDPNHPMDFTEKSVGTPHFMAPEVIRQESQGPALDIYSLGATLYYALTGHPPFNAETVKKILTRHLDDPPPDVRQFFPDYSESLGILIRHALAKDPALRPAAADLASSLRAEAIASDPDSSVSLSSPNSAIFNPPTDPTPSSAVANIESLKTTVGAPPITDRKRFRTRLVCMLLIAAALVIALLMVWLALRNSF